MALVGLWQIYQIIKLNAIYRHDTTLFQFHQLRRNIENFLSKNWDKLPTDEYNQTSLLANHVEKMICNFSIIKTELFNINNFKNYRVEAVKENSIAESLLKESKNKEINRLVLEYKYCIIYSIIQHTPWLKTRLITNLAFVIFKAMFAHASVQWYERQLAWINKREHQYNVYADYNLQ